MRKCPRQFFLLGYNKIKQTAKKKKKTKGHSCLKSVAVQYGGIVMMPLKTCYEHNYRAVSAQSNVI